MADRWTPGGGRAVWALAAALAWAGAPAAAEDPPRARMVLVLEDVEADGASGRWRSVAPGAISELSEDGNWSAEHRWSAPPEQIGEDGFTLTLTTTARTMGGASYAGGARVAGADFSFAPEPPYAEVTLDGGASDTATLAVQVAPRWGIAEDSIVELAPGAQFGPSVHYRYRVTYEDLDEDEAAALAAGDLMAELDCPGGIVISRQPPLACHLVISGWRRDTADPVQVLLPEALDVAGNHANGIQVAGAGMQDLTRMSSSYAWGLKIFACPAASDAVDTCAGRAATAGSTSVPIIVRQAGRKDVALTLELRAIKDPAAVAEVPEGAVPPEGQIEAALDCPEAIVISAWPALTCTIVLTKWRENTIDPVEVLLPGRLDSYGNHANGLQVQAEGEERVLGWVSPHAWSIAIFACPAAVAETGVNCFEHATRPGLATIDIVIRQNGMESAQLKLTLTALPPPS
jgi:hypothetical protein